MTQPLHVHDLARTDYQHIWQAMQRFTQQREADTVDQLWLTEHAPVYTLGLNRRQVRLPERQDIPLVLVDRGGKITYHGPGQLVVYLLLDLQRLGLNIRELVSAMELAMLDLLAGYGVHAEARADAPGVYVDGRKIASLGLRIKQQRCYHGLALNLDMDLAPFQAIDPCGYQGLQVTDLRSLGIHASRSEVSATLLKNLAYRLHYQPVQAETETA